MQALARDRMFWADSALAQSQHNQVYVYRYDFAPNLAKWLGLGITHGMDIGSGLNTYKGAMNLTDFLTSKKRLKTMRKIMHGAFVDFCKTGQADTRLPLNWNRYDTEHQATFIFNETCSFEQAPNQSYFAVWQDINLYQ